MKRSDPGILIAVEGIDGAGKTTQVDLLVRFLEEAGETPVRSKEPTDGTWGRKIRQSAASGRMSLEEELAAFVEDRNEHLREKILPALNVGKIVVLDRYFYSTIAYQGSRGGDVAGIAARMLATAPEPDIVLLLDVPPEVGLARIRERGDTPNTFEKQSSLAAVREVFQTLAKEHSNIVLIDATASVADVAKAVAEAVMKGKLAARL